MRSGTLELSSGRWQWQIVEARTPTEPSSAGLRESAMGDAEPEARGDEVPLRLDLEDPDDPRVRMARSLPPGTEVEDEARARELARDPDERSAVDREGDVWTVVPVERPDAAARSDEDFERPPLAVRFSREGEPPRTGRLPEGRRLGEATRDELLALFES